MIIYVEVCLQLTDTSVIYDDNILTFADVYCVRIISQLFPELPQTYVYVIGYVCLLCLKYRV